jgi:hypothetical protein
MHSIVALGPSQIVKQGDASGTFGLEKIESVVDGSEHAVDRRRYVERRQRLWRRTKAVCFRPARLVRRRGRQANRAWRQSSATEWRPGPAGMRSGTTPVKRIIGGNLVGID